MQPVSPKTLSSTQPSLLLSKHSPKSPKKLLSIITRDHNLTPVLTSDPLTPLASQLNKSSTPRLSTSMGLSKPVEKSKVNNIALYRLPIPADLINIHNVHSDRPSTVRMFKNRLEAVKMEEDPNPLLKKERRSICIQQIKRGDEMKSIKVLIDRDMKDYKRKKKEKQKGSMFITDLWSQDYGKIVMKAAQIDKELKQEKNVDRRPLDLKLKKLVSFYQRKSVMTGRSDENNDNLSARTPRDGVLELPKVAFSETEKDVFSDDLTQTSTEKTFIADDLSVLEKSPPAGLSKFGGNPPITKRLKTIGAIFQNSSMIERKKSRFAFQFDADRAGEEPQERCKTEQDNDETVRIPRNQNRSSIMSRYLYSARSMSVRSDVPLFESGFKKKEQELALSRKTSKDEAFSVKGSPRGQVLLVGKMRNTARENLKAFKEQSSEAIGDLIERCKTETDEKEECLSKLGRLKTVFQKKKVINKNVVNEKMREMIGDLKNMVEMRKSQNAKIACM